MTSNVAGGRPPRGILERSLLRDYLRAILRLGIGLVAGHAVQSEMPSRANSRKSVFPNTAVYFHGGNAEMGRLRRARAAHAGRCHVGSLFTFIPRPALSRRSILQTSGSSGLSWDPSSRDFLSQPELAGCQNSENRRSPVYKTACSDNPKFMTHKVIKLQKQAFLEPATAGLPLWTLWLQWSVQVQRLVRYATSRPRATGHSKS